MGQRCERGGVSRRRLVVDVGPMHRRRPRCRRCETVDVPGGWSPFVQAAPGDVAEEGVCHPVAFVRTCRWSAAWHGNASLGSPVLDCSNELLNSLLEVLCAVAAGDRLHWRSVAGNPIQQLAQ